MLGSALRIGLVAIVVACATQAQDLTNGDFEGAVSSPDQVPDGWTYVAGAPSVAYGQGVYQSTALSCSARTSQSPDVFSQRVYSLSPGSTYDLTFSAYTDEAGSTGTTVSINTDVVKTVSISETGYLPVTVSFVAKGGSGGGDLVSISAWNSQGNSYFDNFSLSPHSMSSSTPDRRRRRAAQLKRDQLLLSNPYCPARLTACPVKTVAVGGKVDLERDGYECLDTQTEYESCGGCAATGQGMNCDDLADQGARPDSITCSAGRCVVYKCQPGFALLSGGSGCKAITGRALRS